MLVKKTLKVFAYLALSLVLLGGGWSNLDPKSNIQNGSL